MWSSEFRGVRDIVNARTVSGCTPLDLALRYEPQATQRQNECTERSALESPYLHNRTATAADHSPQSFTSRVKAAANTIVWLREHGARTARVDPRELAARRHRRQQEEDRKTSWLRSREARFRTRQSVKRLKQSAMFPLMRPQSAGSRPSQSTSSRVPRARQSDTPAIPSHAAPYSRLMRALANIVPPAGDRRVGAKTEAVSANEHAPQHLVLASKTAFLRRQLNRAAAHPSRDVDPGAERLDSVVASADLPTSAADILARAMSTGRRERRGLDYGVAWRALWRILNAMQVCLRGRCMAGDMTCFVVQMKHMSCLARWVFQNEWTRINTFRH